jgi:hypothetical protein
MRRKNDVITFTRAVILCLAFMLGLCCCFAFGDETMPIALNISLSDEVVTEDATKTDFVIAQDETIVIPVQKQPITIIRRSPDGSISPVAVVMSVSEYQRLDEVISDNKKFNRQREVAEVVLACIALFSCILLISRLSSQH